MNMKSCYINSCCTITCTNKKRKRFERWTTLWTTLWTMLRICLEWSSPTVLLVVVYQYPSGSDLGACGNKITLIPVNRLSILSEINDYLHIEFLPTKAKKYVYRKLLGIILYSEFGIRSLQSTAYSLQLTCILY